MDAKSPIQNGTDETFAGFRPDLGFIMYMGAAPYCPAGGTFEGGVFEDGGTLGAAVPELGVDGLEGCGLVDCCSGALYIGAGVGCRAGCGGDCGLTGRDVAAGLGVVGVTPVFIFTKGGILDAVGETGAGLVAEFALADVVAGATGEFGT